MKAVAWQTTPETEASVKFWADRQPSTFTSLPFASLDGLPRKTCPLHPEGCDGHIAKLRAAMDRGEALPPIVVMATPGKRFRVLDGSHRILAAKNSINTHVPAMVIHNELWPTKLGKSQREKEPTRVASVAAFCGDKLLFGRRSDNGKWTLPGGHLEPGEDPKRGAVRELLEETSLRPKSLTVLGDMMIHDGKLQVFAYRCDVDGEASSKNDPDDECEEWRFVEPDKIPDEIMSNLHSPKNVTLKLLGLQEWDEDCQECGDCEKCLAAPLEKKVLDPNAGYEITHVTEPFDPWHGRKPTKPTPPHTLHRTRVFAPNGEMVAHAVHLQIGEGPNAALFADEVKVHYAHRRRGIASAMYAHVEKKTGLKVRPSSMQTDMGEKLWRGNAKNPQFGKSEDLEKGAMQRMAPFNPATDTPDATMEAYGAWQELQVRRNALPPMPPEAHARALHKLHGMTETRRNPTTGEREFLLHRGFRSWEQRRIQGGAFASAAKTSWSPDYKVAHAHGRGSVVSAWVPESKVHAMPMQLGSLKFEQDAQGTNGFHSEKEVVTKPGVFEIATSFRKSEPALDEVERLVQHPNVHEARMALKLQGVTPRHLVMAVRRGEPQLVDEALKHPAANAQVLTECAAEPELATQHLQALAQHPLFGGEHALKLAHHAATGAMNTGAVVDVLARHPSTGVDAINALLPNVEPEQAGRMLRHPHATPEQYRQFFKPLIAHHENTTESMAEQGSVSEAFLDHRMPDDLIEEMASRTFEMGMLRGRAFMLMAFRHPKLPAQFADKLVSQLPVLPDFTDAHVELLKNPALSAKHLDAFLRAKNPTMRALAARHPNIGREQVGHVLSTDGAGAKPWEPIEKFEESVEVWLAKMAFNNPDFRGIRRTKPAGAEQAVDHKPLLAAHPPEHDHLREQFETRIRDNAHVFEPTYRNNGGVSPKLVYDSHDDEGPMRVMLKGFHESGQAQKGYNSGLARAYPHPLAGWAESTSQALYHAADIGHLHQKLHISEVRMVNKGPMTPAVVIHMEPHFRATLASLPKDTKLAPALQEQARKMAVMDFLTANHDRHDGNVLVDEDRSQLLAIDHGYAFHYSLLPSIEPEVLNEQPHTTFRKYFAGKATGAIAGDELENYATDEEKQQAIVNFHPVFQWWSQVGDKVRAKMHQHLEAITDQRLKDHVRSNFTARADWLDAQSKIRSPARSTKWAGEQIPQTRYGAATSAGGVASLSDVESAVGFKRPA